MDKKARKSPDGFEKSVIYQFFLRAFTQEGTLRAAEKLLPHLSDLKFDIITTKLNIKGSTKIVKEENKAKVTIVSDKTLEQIKSSGTIVLTAPNAETTYDIKISGHVKYNIANGHIVQTNILPKTLSVTVNKSSGAPLK
ncbi:MAG: hypothetical protein PHF89_07505 [Eubacteriales bacterium]|jgi:ribosomal protein S8E|nr:hypothetical protein [Eubacteriales bacterium]